MNMFMSENLENMWRNHAMFTLNGDVVVLVTIYTVTMGSLQVNISTWLCLHRNDCLLGQIWHNQFQPHQRNTSGTIV